MSEPDEIKVDSGLTALKISALQTHEIFLELKNAGFEHRDAVQVIGVMLSSGIMFTPARTFGYDFEEFDDEELSEQDLEDLEDGDDTPLP